MESVVLNNYESQISIDGESEIAVENFSGQIIVEGDDAETVVVEVDHSGLIVSDSDTVILDALIPASVEISGDQGPKGDRGAPGQTVWVEGEPGEDALILPGAPGVAGAVSTVPGPQANAVWLEPEVGEDPLLIPGPTGASSTIPGPQSGAIWIDHEQGDDPHWGIPPHGSMHGRGSSDQIGSVTKVLVDAPTITVDAALANTFRVTITGDRTFNFIGPFPGLEFILMITQDGVGSRYVDWGANARFSLGVAPVLSTGPGRTDIFRLVDAGDGVHWLVFYGSIGYQ